MKRLRLAFWLRAIDLAALCSGFGSPLFLWCVARAADATDWGEAGPSTGWDDAC